MQRPRPITISAALLCAGLGARAQMHHVDAPEQTTRAVAVYEWTGELKKPAAMRLVPVSLFLGGAMHDAGTYLARPVPFALESGTVYEIDRAGAPLALLDVKMARDVASTDATTDNAEGSWYGYGVFPPPPKSRPSTLKPAKTLASIEGGEDDRPHFVAARPQTDSTAKSTSPHADDSDDSERPTLRHRSEDDTASSDKASKTKREKPQGYVTGVGSLNDDPDRPTLRRGAGAVDDVPPLEGLPANMQQSVAVSDPRVTADPHEFARAWENAAEEQSMLASMRALALPLVEAYMRTNGLLASPITAMASSAAEGPLLHTSVTTDGAPPRLVRTPNGIHTQTQPEAQPATTTRGTASLRKKAVAPVLPVAFASEHVRGYFLSYGGLPTFVYTAESPAHPAAAVTATARVSVALVAQRLPTGELQVSLRSITDSGHQNRTPWMRFVDAVDADGSHRASLLFELRAAHTRQFALYRLVSANAEQTFVTDPMQ